MLVRRLSDKKIYDDSAMLTRGLRTALQFSVNYQPPEGGWPFDITARIYFEVWRGVMLWAPLAAPTVEEFRRRLRAFTARWLGACFAAILNWSTC